MTGVVSDPTGAVLPDTVVVLKNPGTGVTFTQTTKSNGAYRFTNVPADNGYTATFTHPGFVAREVKNLALEVGITRTEDARLTVGTAEQIEVSGSGNEVTINTTDATIGNNISPELLNELPVQNRDNPSALFTLQPGVTLSGSTTGSRTDQDQVTLDGLDVNDIATGSAFTIVAKAPIDSVQEFRGTVGGFGTDSGPGGGGQFQLVTKSGTNHFHGNLNEYHRDTSTAANTWFNNDNRLPRTPLIRNQFGGNVGGPIKHDKAFFFFDFNDSRIIQSSSVNRTVPLNSLRSGNISYILNKDSASGATCGATSRQNTTPTCIGTYTPAQVQALDPAGIGEDPIIFALINSRYPLANNFSGGDGVNTGTFSFTTPTPSFETNYVTKLDYNITPTQKLFARATVVRQNSVQSTPQFPTDGNIAPFVDRSYAWVVGHTWQIGNNKVNQAAFGETVSDFNFSRTNLNPNGANLITFGDGTTTLLSDPYLTPVNGQGRHIPIPQFSDNFQWQKGAHTFELGGFFKFINSSDFTKLDYNTASIGLGGQTLGLNSSLRPVGIRSAGTTSSNDWDSAFAFALGRIGSISQQFNYASSGTAFPSGTGDNRNYRYYQTELYVGDTWKFTKSLTLSYGLNWQIFSVPYEKNGLESVATTTANPNTPITFDQYFGARVKQSASSATGNAAVPLITYVLGGKANNGPALYNSELHDFAPRVAFAYNPSFDRKTVINGSVGLVYDRTVVNAVQYQQDQHSYLFQQSVTTANGVSTNPTSSLKNDPRLTAANANYTAPAPPPSPSRPFTPFVSGGVPFGLQNGEAFNTQIDPNLKTPYNIIAGFGMQHEFAGGFILKANYVGRFGRRLLGQADANQIIDFADPASGQLLSAAFANMTTQVRACNNACTANLPAQPWFENLVAPGIGKANGYPNNTSFLADNLGGLPFNGDFADTVQAISGLIPPNVGMGAQFSENTFYTNKGFSTYNGLLVTLHKNLRKGLQFDVNYTFSHSMDNVSLIANAGAAGGYGFICDVVRPRLCRSNSDFDVTQITSGLFTYQLPFGHGRTFASSAPRWLDEVIGGWDVSSLINQNSGIAYGTVSNAFVAGYANDAPAIFTGNPNDLRAHINKTTGTNTVSLYTNRTQAQTEFIGPVGFNIGTRNQFRGPGFFNMDSGLAKNFAILPDRGINLKFRADFYNVLNHPSFSTPAQPGANTDITNGNFGVITSTSSSARVGQFALRLEF
jgi:hypothetical protein